MPDVELRLRQLATGTEQTLQTSNWHLVQRTNLSGETTLTIATFTVAATGEYELFNPATSQFKPGDQLRIEVVVQVWRGTAGKMEGKAYVGDKLACEAIVTCRLVDRERKTSGEATPEPAAEHAQSK